MREHEPQPHQSNPHDKRREHAAGPEHDGVGHACQNKADGEDRSSPDSHGESATHPAAEDRHDSERRHDEPDDEVVEAIGPRDIGSEVGEAPDDQDPFEEHNEVRQYARPLREKSRERREHFALGIALGRNAAADAQKQRGGDD